MDKRGIKSAVRILVLMALLSLMLFLAFGCKSIKKSVSEKTDTQDSVRIEYREKIVKVPVTVEVEVPVEVKEKFSNDSTSHLETSFAVSDAAMIWIDGVAFLRHTLKNKPQKIAKTDTANVVEKETIQWRTRRVTYTKTEYVKTDLSWWHKGLIYIGVIAIFIGLIIIVSLLLKLRR